MGLINHRSCPNCGVHAHRQVSGRLGWHECLSCGAQFSEHGHVVVPREQLWSTEALTAQRTQKLLGWFKWLSIVVIGSALLIGVGSWLVSWLKPADTPAGAVPHLLASTVVDLGNPPALLRVFERYTEQGRSLQTVLDRLDNGRRVGQLQDFPLTADETEKTVEFLRYASGNLCMVLQARQFWCLDAPQARWHDQTAAIEGLLPAGVQSLAVQGEEWPDALRVQGNDGQSYYLNLQAGKFMPQSQALAQFAQESEHYTENWQSFGLAPVGGADSSDASLSYLVSYGLKGGTTQMRHQPRLPLYRWNSDTMNVQQFQPIGDGFALRAADARTPGFFQMRVPIPMRARRDARVLASNARAALVIYTPQGIDGSEGAVLDIVARDTLQVLWTEVVDRVPQLMLEAPTLQADGFSQGFYLRSGPAQPLMLIDTQGKVLHDFSSGKGSEHGNWLARVQSWF